MSDSGFLPPQGPPPSRKPEVPEGWAAQWNDQYKEWFYVNTYTKISQWDKPTSPVYPPGEAPLDGSPAGPPPGYTSGSGAAPTDKKSTNPFDETTHTHASQLGSSSKSQEADDARLAAQLQAEEDAHGSSSRDAAGASQGYYSGNSSNSQAQQGPFAGLGDHGKGKAKGGFLNRIKEKLNNGGAGSHSSGGAYAGYQQHQQPYFAPQHQQGYYPPQQGYYGPQQAYGRPARSGGGGMGMGGGMALGAGAGLLGGVLVADAINDGQQDAYQDGYNDGQDGDDFGGGGDDFGGGDF